MSDKNEIDRWRRSLDEAEEELEAKTRQFADMQSFFCENMTKLIQQFDRENVLRDELKDFEKLSYDTSLDAKDLASLRANVENLVARSSNITVSESVTGLESSPGSNLNSNLNSDLNSDLNFDLNEKKPEADPSQFCALLISEILYQLLEKISLPKDLSNRLGELKKQLQKGVTMNKWAGMLTEVSDMASDVQLKINHERLDIEIFLKQVTGRLTELDDYIQGSQSHFERTKMNSKALGDAVKMEMQNLVSNADAESDITTLKHQIQSGLAAIEKHIDGYKKTEIEHHTNANQDVEKLLGRLAELEQESKKLKARVQKERMQAQIDTLTGIANRLGYDQHLSQEYARWKRFGNPLTIVVWDIDHFKRINDDYGHAAGDKALKTIASLLASKVRETDYLARFGGEEFVLIMPGATEKSAKPVAEKLRETVESSGFHFKGAPVTITISAGIAEFCENDTPITVFERADKALYFAKENGRNQVAIGSVK